MSQACAGMPYSTTMSQACAGMSQTGNVSVC